MPTGRYPFIDIAVHETVRSRYCAGEALILVSPFLDTILWINGAGARLLGYQSLYACMDAGLNTSGAAYRQIEAAARVVRSRSGTYPFVMRSDPGFKQELRSAQLEKIILPDGNPALLISAPAGEKAKTPAQMAHAVLDGFEDTETNAAVLDEHGGILDATSSFARIRLGDELRQQIVSGVSDKSGRLTKHPIPTALGQLPSAIARLSDDPALFLLFAVETPVDGDAPAPRPHDDPEPAPEPESEAQNPRPKAAAGERMAIVPSVLNMVPAEETAADVSEDPAAEVTANDEAAEGAGSDTTAAEDKDDAQPRPEDAAGDHARTETDTGAAGKDGDASAFVFNPEKRPTRFVWKIDADGVFKEISADFGETVGPNAADVRNRKFADVAQVFNIDPDHTIADLLSKRDTWSGKTVLWPVQGTDLRVPVDLAALPTYSRERAFDGFRGFGIVRPADAQADPEKIGIALGDASGFPAAASEPDNEASEETNRKPADDDETGNDNPAATDGDAAEKPVLEISGTPGRRRSDKVIRLEDRRSQARDGLSNTEKQAFREIAQRLSAARRARGADDNEAPEPFGKRKTPPQRPATEKDEDDAGKQRTSGTPEQPPASQPVESASDVGDPPQKPLPDDRKTARPEGNFVTPAIIEQLPTPVIVHDGVTIFYINEEFRQLTGYLTKSELNEAGGMAGLFDDGDGAGGDESVSTGGDLALRSRDGSQLSVRAKLRSVGWETGRALMLALQPLAGVTNIVDDAVREPETPPLQPVMPDEADPAPVSALQVEVDELRSILETATDGVVLIGEDGIIRSMNNSACALFDYDETETSGKPFAMLFAHESQRAVKDYLSGLTGNGVASVLNDGREVIGREASGGFLPLFMTIGHLSGSNGYCAVMRDITQWKRAEEELRSAKREAETASSLKSDFLARVSHEIRTPLNAIIGFAELMAEERFGPIGSPRYVEYANDIRRSGKHVLDIVNDLLDISKIEAGEQELDFAAVSLNDALLEAISILQPQANDRRVIMRTSLSSDVPQVVADIRSIKQIAINLLSNAIRFTPAGGQVVVSTTYESNGNVSLRIRDTGVGMTRVELEQAMKPFKQVAGLNRPRGDGTGLGLPLAKAMAEANRAQFAMNSQPGQGTLIEIVFPSQRVLAE